MSQVPTARHHALSRTSPKGKGLPFIGRCMLCGKTDLPASAVTWHCENPMRMSKDDVLLEAIRPQ